MSIKKTKKNKTVKRVITVDYSILTCQNCGHTEEIEGTVSYYKLPDNWASLTLESLGAIRCCDWLLCNYCANKVRKVAGLKEI
jgi:hypothetical protein